MGDTAERLAPTLEPPAPVDHRRARWGWVVVVVALGLATTAVVGARLVPASGYAPLVAGGAVSISGATYIEEPTDATSALDVPRYQLPFVPGETHTMVVDVVNTGSSSIEVLDGVPAAALPLMPLGVAAVGVLQDDGVGGLPWPQTIEPGHSLKLAVVLRIGSCHSSGNGVTATLSGVSLSTRTLWFERQADIALLTPVATTVDQSHCTG